MKHPKSGFTLMEILVIVFIIIVIASLGTMAVRSGYKKTVSLKCMSNLKNLYTMSVIYFQEHSALEEDEDLLTLLGKNNPESIRCPAMSDPDKSHYLVWTPTMKFINKEKTIFSREPRLFIIDPYENVHGNYSLGVLNNGKCIQIFSEDIGQRERDGISTISTTSRAKDASLDTQNPLGVPMKGITEESNIALASRDSSNSVAMNEGNFSSRSEWIQLLRVKFIDTIIRREEGRLDWKTDGAYELEIS